MTKYDPLVTYEGLVRALEGTLLLLDHYQPRIRDKDFRGFLSSSRRLLAQEQIRLELMQKQRKQQTPTPMPGQEDV